jgi:hypothetical protein
VIWFYPINVRQEFLTAKIAKKTAKLSALRALAVKFDRVEDLTATWVQPWLM